MPYSIGVSLVWISSLIRCFSWFHIADNVDIDEFLFLFGSSPIAGSSRFHQVTLIILIIFFKWCLKLDFISCNVMHFLRRASFLCERCNGGNPYCKYGSWNTCICSSRAILCNMTCICLRYWFLNPYKTETCVSLQVCKIGPDSGTDLVRSL